MSALRAQDRRHVAFVMSSLPMGGAQTQFVSLLAWGAAHRSDWRVTLLLFTVECDVTLRARLADAGVAVVTVERRGRPFAVFFATLVKWFRSQRPDVVHTVLSGTAGTWGRLAARLTRTRRIVHSERSLTPRRTRLQRMLEPILHRFTDRFFTNAHAIAARLETEGVPHERVVVLRNGVDLERFAEATPHLGSLGGT
jgi:glycosyltransferase involved in cell wall biosynthesis